MSEEKKVKKEEQQIDTAKETARRMRIVDTGSEIQNVDYWLVSGTPEEMIIRFGDTKKSKKSNTIDITQKVVLNYYSAKRLRDALAQTLQKYEEALSAMKV